VFPYCGFWSLLYGPLYAHVQSMWGGCSTCYVKLHIPLANIFIYSFTVQSIGLSSRLLLYSIFVLYLFYFFVSY
jgi:hypothetical protein